jgi:site-specific DNA-methyltransferase (adenine-specific)
VYCSKKADGKFSIATQFKQREGNIRLPKAEHTWNKAGKCTFCGAGNKAEYGWGEGAEANVDKAADTAHAVGQAAQDAGKKHNWY